MMPIGQANFDDGSYILLADSGYAVSSTKKGSAVKRCLRRGNTRYTDLPWIVWLMPPGSRNSDFHAYLFRPSAGFLARWPNLPKQGYVVARNIDTAQKWLEKHFSESAKRRSGLAKDGLTQTMKLVNARSNPGRFVSHRREALNRPGVVNVRWNIAGGFCSIRAEDNLIHAAAAVNGGQSGINDALMSAANSVNGAINAYIRKHGRSFFDADHAFDIWEAPFKEAVKSHHR